jgi:RimJ/RimL family protein N-acetyltransferase
MNDVITLRDIAAEDLQIIFEQQLDPEANFMAAFTCKDPTDREAFNAHWAKIFANDSIVKKAVIRDGMLVGNVASFMNGDHREICYWIGKEYWGQGIASAALKLLLEEVETRPIYSAAAKDNIASLRVLQKCGFEIIDESKGFANARQCEVEEYHLRLS